MPRRVPERSKQAAHPEGVLEQDLATCDHGAAAHAHGAAGHVHGAAGHVHGAAGHVHGAAGHAHGAAGHAHGAAAHAHGAAGGTEAGSARAQGAAGEPTGSAGPGRNVVAARDPEAVEGAVRLFRALGDPQRLRLMELLGSGEVCVSELAATTGETLSAISQRLRLLRAERLVRSRREGKHVFYRVDDAHVLSLVAAALDHAAESKA